MWTLDELVERVREALEAEYPGAPNGRVRDLPDRRAIRWYSTIGLVDRPLGMRGRSALYGPRHLEQLVAIKRRQAEGLTLAQIQAELTGLSPSALTDIAHVPPGLLVMVDVEAPPDHSPRPRFWASPPAPAAPPAPASTMPPAQPFTGLPLGGGVLLLVPRVLTEADRDAVAEAAAPLLDLLAARGLLVAEGSIDGSPS
ncbi:MerR family transcriptional regulator [Paractinoplanes hotanensis]|uniref:MerR family transcriptional regulator n=1 Tax=Paractinoplanes hotanensis TaxID=2906497 RepID=A0ABT0Y0R3_9ACTN|nr:MerR family transcriptional regulator [Actinoplanes hotanensis]MCM4079628.1 MerR family transcriptional regulator [Actinoplanes hotanensis]